MIIFNMVLISAKVTLVYKSGTRGEDYESKYMYFLNDPFDISP